jgi:hypothetical protein
MKNTFIKEFIKYLLDYLSNSKYNEEFLNKHSKVKNRAYSRYLKTEGVLR